MNIVIIGATGNVGSHLLAEALRRGHLVTAIARRIDALAPSSSVRPMKGDITDEVTLTTQLRGHDAVISATTFVRSDAALLLRAVKAAGVPRLLVVGGAGSLEVAPGVSLVDTPNFPSEYKSEALAGRLFLAQLRNESELNWTFLSPSAILTPDGATGKFRLGGEQLLVDGEGQSAISVGDYAVAMIDELERNAHPRERFTVGY